MAYRVTAGHVEVDTGGAQTRVKYGELLPGDVSQEQIDHELNLGTIEETGEQGERMHSGGLPPGLSVSATLQWAGDDPTRAQTAIDAEYEKASPRATLVDRLIALRDRREGADADPDAGPSVDS